MHDIKGHVIYYTEELLQYFTSSAVTFAASDDSLSATGIGSGFTAGDYIYVSGSSETANNTRWLTTVVAADKITVSGSITDDNAGETIKVNQEYVGSWQKVDMYAKVIGAINCSGACTIYIDFSYDEGTTTTYYASTSVTGGTPNLVTSEVVAPHARMRIRNTDTDQTSLYAVFYGRTQS